MFESALDLIRKYLSPPQLYITIALVLIFSLAIFLRIYDITDEPICCNPVRQLQGAVISRGIYYEIFPIEDDITVNRAISMKNSMAEHEPRFLQNIVAFTYVIAGKEIPWVAGLYNNLFWMVGGIALFALARRIAITSNPIDENSSTAYLTASFSGLLALLYYMVLPFSVITSRSFQPDPGMVMWLILASYALFRFMQEETWIWAILTGLLSGIAILVKVVALGPIASAIIAAILFLYGPKTIKGIPSALVRILRQPKLWIMGLLMVAPPILFYVSRQQRAFDYASGWIFSMWNLLLTPGMYINWATLVIRLFNPVALILALLGLWFSRGRSRALLLGLWVGYILYGLFFPYQIGTHDYYHLMLVPIISLTMVPMFQVVISRLANLSLVWRIGFIMLVLLVTAYYSWHSLTFWARVDYRDQPIVWREISSQIPKDGKTIAVTQDFGLRMLYYGWRRVDLWPNANQIEVREMREKGIPFDSLFAKQTKGKKYFLITDFEDFEEQPELKDFLNNQFKILEHNEHYIIFDLSQSN